MFSSYRRGDPVVQRILFGDAYLGVDKIAQQHLFRDMLKPGNKKGMKNIQLGSCDFVWRWLKM